MLCCNASFFIAHVLYHSKVVDFSMKKTKKARRYFAAPLNLALRLSVAIIFSSAAASVVYGRVKYDKNKEKEREEGISDA